jgi:predicted lipid-binding transport protein (Tim44 family)
MANIKFKNKLVISLLALAMLTCNFAYAKKVGGGKSIGKQSSTVTNNQNSLPAKPDATPVGQNTSSAAKPNAAPASAPAPAAQPSRFGGMGGILGGVAAGIGLSYLFSHMGMGGMGEGLASMMSGILMIAVVGFLVMFLIRRFGSQSNMAYKPATPGVFNNANVEPNLNRGWNSTNPSVNQEPQFKSSNLATPILESVGHGSNQSDITPSNMSDKESFLQNAKSLFIQLQEASDQQNLEKLKEYTTPELYELLRQDMLSRVSAYSFTQVLTLAADLIAVEEDGKEYLASTRFSGSLREEKDGPITEFEEVWNWTKPIQGNTGWLLCGIQQIN